MDQASRQHRRKERRRLADLGRKALARGFSDNLDDEVSIGVAALICDKLSETGNAARAGEAAAIAEQVLEKSNATYEKDPKVACRRGCSHCCVTVASVTPPEIFRVADWLRRNRLHDADMSPAAVIARAKAKAGATLDDDVQAEGALPRARRPRLRRAPRPPDQLPPVPLDFGRRLHHELRHGPRPGALCRRRD